MYGRLCLNGVAVAAEAVKHRNHGNDDDHIIIGRLNRVDRPPIERRVPSSNAPVATSAAQLVMRRCTKFESTPLRRLIELFFARLKATN